MSLMIEHRKRGMKRAYSYDENSMLPKGREFFIAIFFICFGVLSAVGRGCFQCLCAAKS